MQRKSDVSSANEIQRFESEKVHVDWIFWLVSLRFSSACLAGSSLFFEWPKPHVWGMSELYPLHVATGAL